MRIVRVIAVAGIAILSSCAGKNATAPKAPLATSANLATWNGGSIDQSRWDEFRKNNGINPAADSKELERIFNDYLRLNLEARAAQDAGITSDSSKAKRWESIKQRIRHDFLRREFVGEQCAFPDSAIRKWAAAQDSSVRKLPMDSLRRMGGKALLLEHVRLDSVYKANSLQFNRTVSVGLPFDSVKPQVREIALRGAKTASDSARAVSTSRLDSVYKANIAQFHRDSGFLPPFDSVKARVSDLAFRTLQEKLQREYFTSRREAYGTKVRNVVRPPIPDDSLKAFWKQNADRWSSTPMYRLSALGSSDSAKLAKAVAGAKDFASFRKLSAKFPVGFPVHAPEGSLGRVKQQFALPYGIGMVPALFAQLDSVKVGERTTVLKGNDTLYMVAWLEARDSSVIRPFADVRSDVQAAWEQLHPFVAPDSSVLATWDKGVLFHKSDVDFISEEIPPQMRRQFPPERVLDFMILWAVADRVALETGFAARPSVQGAIQENSVAYWSQEFRSSADRQAYLFPRKACDSSLAAFASSMPKSFAPDTAGSNRDGARALLLGRGEIETSYLEGIDNFRKDSVFLPLDSVRTQVFGRLRPVLDERGQARVDSVLKARYQVVVSPAAPKGPARLSGRAALDSGRAHHDRRQLEEAEALYRQVEQDASQPDSLRSQALFQLGQLFNESQNYLRSLESYRGVLRRYPKSNEAYKAQFMIAFTYSEYLKAEKVAVAEYRKVLSDYPKCDLASDADWMIRNILSGGALMPKFDDSAFVADSIARADSLKKVSGGKDPAKGASKAGAQKPADPKVAPVAKPAAKQEPAKTDAPKAAKPAAPRVDSTAKSKPAAKSSAKTDSAKAGKSE